MTKMAATPIYGKSLQISSTEPIHMILKLGMQHQGLKLNKVYLNGDPVLTVIYFIARSNLVMNLKRKIFVQPF